jgi:triosephosphate isomerase (TIM)
MRRSIFVGNWKMNMLISSSEKWVEELLCASDFLGNFDIVVAPSFTSLSAVSNLIKGSRVQLAGQNMASEVEGARTGEVSAAMLQDAGCDYVILGHSERRQYHSESDKLINRKVLLASETTLNIILCIGESFEERNEVKTKEVLERQLLGGFEGVSEEKLISLSIAYEPIWAIGTGQTANPNQVQDIHGFLRSWCEKSYGGKMASAIRILYGGSVDCQCSLSLMSQPDIDGLLVGGASLKSKSFYDIITSSFETGD